MHVHIFACIELPEQYDVLRGHSREALCSREPATATHGFASELGVACFGLLRHNSRTTWMQLPVPMRPNLSSYLLAVCQPAIRPDLVLAQKSLPNRPRPTDRRLRPPAIYFFPDTFPPLRPGHADFSLSGNNGRSRISKVSLITHNDRCYTLRHRATTVTFDDAGNCRLGSYATRRRFYAAAGLRREPRSKRRDVRRPARPILFPRFRHRLVRVAPRQRCPFATRGARVLVELMQNTR